MRPRQVLVAIHRWIGLAMALFLVIEGLSGALLAFRGPLTRWLDPGLYSRPPAPGATRLDLATLIETAQRLDPESTFRWFLPLGDDVALVFLVPKPTRPGEAAPEHEGRYLALDPYTGREVRRMTDGLYSGAGVLANVMPFVYDLHKTLAVGTKGAWILAITALLWTIDCLAGAYLTFPVTRERFWSRWKPAWRIKWGARWQRINFDVHRAASLWLWLVLLAFAWSSVELVDQLSVFGATMEFAFGPLEFQAGQPSVKGGAPRIDWHQAQAHATELAQQRGRLDGIRIGEPDGLWYDGEARQYTMRFDTSRRFPDDRSLIVSFDGDSGAPLTPPGPVSGNANAFVSFLLADFHMVTGRFDYTEYRVLVVLFGLALAAISISGILVWMAKRKGRTLARRRRDGGADFRTESS